MTIATGQVILAADTLKHATAAGRLAFASSTELTIATGVVTVNANWYRVDTEGDAASDDLDTITNGAEVRDGFLLFLRAENAARTVVVKHNTGNILCMNGVDQSLDDSHDIAVLVYDSNLTKWSVLGFLGPLTVDTASIVASAVTAAKLASDAVTTAKILDANVTTAKINDLAVTTGKVAANAITYAKLSASGASASQVLQYNGSALAWATVAGTTGMTFTARQGGSASVFSTAGTSNYTPANVSVQAGVMTLAGGAGTAVTFPSAFSQAPIVLVTADTTSGTGISASVKGITASGCDLITWDASGANVAGVAHWIAIGPP